MNDLTLLALDSLTSKQGLPVIYPQYHPETGERLLLGYPVAICPSMPSIGVNNTPIAFGATGYFVTRCVKEQTKITVLFERFAEFGKIGYRAQMRANGMLLGVSTDTPIKLLQNASS
jgi:HK97 family phage major capsid protein